jgi:hypothetical protein
MAIYSIDWSSDANITASIKNALTTAGILTTNHYETTNRLIVTTARSNKLIRFVIGGTRIQVYIGDSWSSGDAVTNQVTINSNATATMVQGALIITDKILYIGQRDNAASPYHVNAMFTRVDSVTAEYIAMGWNCSTANGTQAMRDTTNNAGVILFPMKSTLISSDGYYYEVNIPAATPGGLLLGSALQGVKCLMRDWIRSTLYQEYGNDVAVQGGWTDGLSNYFPSSFIIANGSSWAPA